MCLRWSIMKWNSAIISLLQNTTFGGIQGFSRKPSTPWTDDAGNFAGIVHQERNWTYVLFAGAGHTVPLSKPAAVRLSLLFSFCLFEHKPFWLVQTRRLLSFASLYWDVTKRAWSPVRAGRYLLLVGKVPPWQVIIYPGVLFITDLAQHSPRLPTQRQLLRHGIVSSPQLGRENVC